MLIKKKKFSISIIVCFLIISGLTSHVYADQALQSFKGFWVYGFEQSFLETCGGQRYWMWVPDHFSGKYKMEGYRNPVKVAGYLLPPDPDNNINSLLDVLKLVDIKHFNFKC